MLPMPKNAPWQSAVRMRAQKKKQEGRSQSAQGIADEEHPHQNQQRPFPVHVRQGKRHQRRAQGDAERIAGDKNPCLRDADLETVSEIRQQPHDDEFRGADAKG